ncbi:MAG: carboxypeptidase-like regulatory domain-containing protein [Candidatus Udaeobacter sp.]
MSSVLKYLVSACVFLIIAGSALIDAAPPGFVVGHLQIVSPREVELADATPSKITAENYTDYPLIILSRDGEKEIARVTADGSGQYRVALPPGNYVLDVQGRRPKGHVRAKPQPFTIISNQTVRVDMNIDTAIR